MKIIAKTADGYLLEATGGEIASLIGYSSVYEQEQGGRRAEVGARVDISGMYGRLTRIARLPRELGASAKMLRAAAELIEFATPAVSETSPDVTP